MIDQDTIPAFIYSHHGHRMLSLVMSDEFNIDNRSFADGDDLLFDAVEKPDDSNQAIQFYNSSREYVTTKNGSLVLTTRAIKTSWVQWSSDKLQPELLTKNYTSGESIV
jgi:hypothetical protein